MKESVYKNHNEARVLCVSPSSRCEFMHEPDFPVPHMGSRMLVPKEKFIQWAEEHMTMPKLVGTCSEPTAMKSPPP